MAIAVMIVAASACNQGQARDDSGRASGNSAGSGGAPANGDASLPASVRDYELTDAGYRKWVAAQRVLDTLSGLTPPPRFASCCVSEAELNRAVAYLEGEPRTRRAIEAAGLSVRDYVLTTIALDQALVLNTKKSPPPTRASARKNTAVVAQHQDELSGVWRDMRFRLAEQQQAEAAGTIDSVRIDSVAAPPAAGTATSTGMLVPAGTIVDLRSDTRVCTNKTKPGDKFTATVTRPVDAAGLVAVPPGSKATLMVTRRERSDRVSDPIVIELAVSSLYVGGTSYPVKADIASAQVERVRTRKAGNDAAAVVGGAVAGAVAGQAIGKDSKSTAIGAAVGAAAGAGVAQATANYDGCIPQGGSIRITLREPLRIVGLEMVRR